MLDDADDWPVASQYRDISFNSLKEQIMFDAIWKAVVVVVVTKTAEVIIEAIDD